MHFKIVINFSACKYWLEVVVDFLAQNSCFSLHRSTCSMDDNCLGWFMVSALVMRKSTGRFKPTRNGEIF